MATKIQLRRDYAANWKSTNPVLSLGEPGVELDTHEMKVGDGITPWNSLSYIQTGGQDATENMFVKVNGMSDDLAYPWSGTVSVSTDGLNWTPSTFNNSATEYQFPQVEHVAVGGGRIVYATYEDSNYMDEDRYELRWAYNPFEKPRHPTSDLVRRGPNGEDINYWWNVRFVNGMFVAVGDYYDDMRGDYYYPIAIYSTDGNNWTKINIDLDQVAAKIAAKHAQDGAVQGLSMADVAYGDGGWLFTAHWTYADTNSTQNPAGGYFLSTLSTGLSDSNWISGIPGAYISRFDGHGWVAWTNYDANTGYPAAYFNSNMDPTMGSWRTVNLQTVKQTVVPWDTNWCIWDVAAGKVGNDDWIVFSDGEVGLLATKDQGVTWKILQTTPNTAKLLNIVDQTPVRINNWNDSSPNTGEKVIITGSPVAGLNGTFYVKNDYSTGYDIDLYTDSALSVPLASLNDHSLVVSKDIDVKFGEYTAKMSDVTGLVVGMAAEGYTGFTTWEDNNTGNDSTSEPNTIQSIDPVANTVTMKFPWSGDNNSSYSQDFVPVLSRSYGDGLNAVEYGDGAFVGFSWNNLQRSYKTTDMNTWQSTLQGRSAQNDTLQNIDQIGSIVYGTVTTHSALLRSNSSTSPGFTNFLSVSDTFQMNVVNTDPTWTNSGLSTGGAYDYSPNAPSQGVISIDPSVGEWIMGVSMSGEGFWGSVGYWYNTYIGSYNDGEGYNSEGDSLQNSVKIRAFDYSWNFENNSGYMYSQRISVGDGEGYDNYMNGDSVLHGIYFYNPDNNSTTTSKKQIYVTNGSLEMYSSYGHLGEGFTQLNWDDTNYLWVDWYGTTIETEGYQWNFTDDCNSDSYGVLYQPESALIQTSGYWTIGDYQNDWAGAYITADNYEGYDPGEIIIHAQGDHGYQYNYITGTIVDATISADGNGYYYATVINVDPEVVSRVVYYQQVGNVSGVGTWNGYAEVDGWSGTTIYLRLQGSAFTNGDTVFDLLNTNSTVSHEYVFDRYGKISMGYGGRLQTSCFWSVGDYDNDYSRTYIGSGISPLLYNGDRYDAYDIDISADDYHWFFDRNGNLTLPPGGDILDTDGISVLAKDLPQSILSGGTDYTLSYSDRGKHLYLTSAGNIKIPTNATVAFPIGSCITLVTDSNHSTHIAPVYSGVTTVILSKFGSSTNISVPADTYVTILKIETDKWIVQSA